MKQKLSELAVRVIDEKLPPVNGSHLHYALRLAMLELFTETFKRGVESCRAKDRKNALNTALSVESSVDLEN
jgi:hypothetical protein